MRRRMTTLLGLAVSLGLQASTWGQAVIYNWNNTNGGSYHSASNWTPSGPPSTDDHRAHFNLNATYTTTFSQTSSRTGLFEVRQGNVTFQAAAGQTNHVFYVENTANDYSYVGPRATDSATSATLTIRNFNYNPPNWVAMYIENLGVGDVAGKAGTLNVNNSFVHVLANLNLSYGGFVNIGQAGTGNVNVTNGGKFHTGTTRLGQHEGHILVSGVGSYFTADFLGMGSGAGEATFTVTNNASAYINTLATSSPTTAVVDVNNQGTLLIGDALRIGYFTNPQAMDNPTGVVTVGTNSTLRLENAAELGLAYFWNNSRGELHITGTNALLDAEQSTLNIGLGGTAEVNVEYGGLANIKNLVMGSNAGSAGTLNIFGSNAQVVTHNNSSEISYIGLNGTATINVSAGGKLVEQGYMQTGDYDASLTGSATINITSGGSIDTGGLYLGLGNTTSHLLVDGTGSLLETGFLYLGSGTFANARGTALVTNFGRIEGIDLSIGGSTTQNQLTIQSQGSVAITGASNIGYGRGTLLIETGGFFYSGGNVNVAPNGGIGTITLNHLGSAFTTQGNLNLGSAQAGTATLNINPATTATVAGTATIWSNSIINLHGGTLNVGAFQFQGGALNWSTGTVNFSQTSVLDNPLLNALIGTSHSIGQNKTLGSINAATLTVASNLSVEGGRLNSSGELQVSPATNLIIRQGGEAASALTTTNQGNIVVENGGTFAPRVGMLNLGSLQLNGLSAQVTGGTIDNRGTIRGTGVIHNHLSNSTNGQVRVAASDWLTFNGAGNTNQGSVQLLGGVLEFANNLNTGTQGFISGHGTLLTSSGAQGGLGLVNTGTFAFSGGNTNIYGDVQNNTTGRIVTSGGSVTTFHDDVLHNGVEIRTSTGSTSVFFGNVSGAGPFTGAGLVQFESDLRPGNSPADISFGGDVEFSITARLLTEIGGLRAGSEYDRLSVQGQVILNGLLDVQLINGFTPNAGDLFTIINNQGINPVLGTFAGLPEGTSFISGGQYWNITYFGGTGNDVMLSAVPEPTTWALLGLTGLGVAGYYGHRRRRGEQNAEKDMGSEARV